MNHRIQEMEEFMDNGKSEYVVKKSGYRIAHTSRLSAKQRMNQNMKQR